MTVFVDLKDIIVLALFVLAGAIVVVVMVCHWLKQARCRHGRYYENRSCDAVCSDCGKNLGFIGNMR